MPAHASALRPWQRPLPEKEPLYQMLAEHLETFIERTRTLDRQIPALVEKEVRAYLDCGVLAHGFLRVRCEECRCGSTTDFGREIPVELQENQ